MAAEEATNGVLLNRKGKERNIDPLRLFTSNHAFAYCYASDELLEWWAKNPRITFPEYERQMYESAPPEDEEPWVPPDEGEEPWASASQWGHDDETPF